MNGDSLEWRLSTGTASGLDTASTPAASLGGYRSSTRLDSFESTVTTTQGTTDRHIVLDTARSGDSAQQHRGKYLAAVTGAAADALFVARIVDFQVVGGAGSFQLDRPAPAAFTSGDYYRVTDAATLFENVSVAEAASGIEDWKFLFFHNATGLTLTGVQFYVIPINPSGCTLEIKAAALADPTLNVTIANRFTSPLNEWGQVDPDASGDWNETHPLFDPLTPALAIPPSAMTCNNTLAIGLLAKRTIPAGIVKRKSVAFHLVAVTTNAGNDPDPLVSMQPVVWDVDGLDDSVAFERDRWVYINGGARMKATVTDTNGDPVEGRAVEFSKVGLGTIVDEGSDFQTDSDGEVLTTYLATTDPAEEGNTVTLRASIGSGDEV